MTEINELLSMDENIIEIYKNIFDKIDFAVLIINLKNQEILFENSSFLSIDKNRIKDILEFAFKSHSENNGERLGQCTFDIISEQMVFTIGITSFKLKKDVFLVFVKDISSKMISQSKNTISQFHNELSKVIAEIAHEVGNPISAIKTTLQVLYSNIDNWDIEKIKHFVTITINEIERISEFLKYIKSFSLDNKLNIEKHNLLEIINWIIAHNELYLYSNKIDITISIKKEMFVYIDKNAFYQVIFNLIKNSVDALDGINEKKITILAELYNKQFIKMLFKNNGKAIDVDVIKKIFTPLFTTNGKNRGLGLPISLKFMTLMDGMIEAAVPKDIGAEFILYIPITDIKNPV